MRDVIHRLFRSPAALIGMALLLLVAIMAASASVFYPQGPFNLVGQPLAWPGKLPGLPFGTDSLGRDVVAGILHGSRVSLLIGLAATVAALALGIAIGAPSGYFGGWVDDVLMRITDAFQTIPPFLLAIVIIVIVRPSVATIIFAIAAISWPAVARLVRAEFLKLREAEFVAQCHGAHRGERVHHGGLRHPHRVGAVVSGVGRSERDLLGQHGRNGAFGFPHCLVPGGDTRYGHCADGAGPESARRRTE